MKKDSFFKNAKLPFAECRYSRDSDRIFKPHLHRRFSIGAVEVGEIRYQVGQEQAALKPGGLAVINPENLHSCNPVQHDKRSFYMLYLDVGWCLEVQQSLWQNQDFIPVDCIQILDQTLYELYIETMKVLMEECHLLEKEQRLVHLVEAVFARCCCPTVPIETPSKYIGELKSWLESNLEEDQTLLKFAHSKKINPYTLLRHFRHDTGITPHYFRMNCRIEHARKLLQDGHDIGDTAQLCGFFDQSHFHRHFKAMTSVTPRQYQVNFL